MVILVNDFEKVELFMSTLEVDNCIKLKEKLPSHTKEYRDILREEIKLQEKLMRLADYLDNER